MELDNIQIENIRAIVSESDIEQENLIRLLYDISEELNPDDGEMILDLACIIDNL